MTNPHLDLSRAHVEIEAPLEPFVDEPVVTRYASQVVVLLRNEVQSPLTWLLISPLLLLVISTQFVYY